MEKKKLKKWIVAISVYAVLLALLLLVISRQSLNFWTGRVLMILRPLLIGLITAYLLNPLFRLFEKRLLFRVYPHRFRRILSLLLTYLTVLLLLAALVMLILPQLRASILHFVNNSEEYMRGLIGNINDLIATVNEKFLNSSDRTIDPLTYEGISEKITEFFSGVRIDKSYLFGILTSGGLWQMLATAGTLLSTVADVLFGLFISIYLLSSKEKRYAQIMRLRNAVFSEEVNRNITHVCTVADRSFGGFLEGKVLDSSLVGVMTYIVLNILHIDYAIMIAVFIAVTDIVPVIGPFIGVIPSGIIILLTDPSKLIPFLLAILIIQQIDGNIVAPKILGDNTGVSSLCVMIAITVMGSLWGLAGMVLGVPLFATILELVDGHLNNRLKKKGLPSDTSYYVQNGAEPEQQEKKSAKRSRKFRKRNSVVREGGSGDLTSAEKYQLEAYALALKYHIFSVDSDEALALFEKENRLADQKTAGDTPGDVPGAD